ncbi:MAG: replication-associated recombination protein A [Bacteroidales bacterium]|jgi:putative ATPase|nr:replication-associated recombination protein A [Bacteroidales bacterium]MDD2204829.1 replication-associated recombination protein A [Bacteroidales bacterium]MDD3152261.1 replication-associated recombination protein A [Bacteroidales bacterium]MDD3914345.1 replication-associated recombination protein A [Bacteroidales bacterium]MDD4634106.1 replication-associated recombination protein A [Bacteroidales bacterium]
MSNIPLAEALRPTTLDEYIGQQHLVGQGAVIRRSLEAGVLPSLILWGPPGVGKTTLANIIANTLKRPFYSLSAVHSGVKDVRAVLDKAKYDYNPILFIDEIHRFSKAQQDSLLGAVEKGVVTLIGATTENPSFEVIAPLISRCQVYILQPLTIDDLIVLIEKAVSYLKDKLKRTIIVQETEALITLSGGDARKLLNAIDLVIYSELQTKSPTSDIVITDKLILDTVQQNLALYDKNGEMHYDIISAFIKSMRGSDPNAAVYWLARMVDSGEDPEFIARRMLILASEDIGNANPNALLLANTCFDAVKKIGWPESQLILSQTAIYLACSPKSNSAYLAINAATDCIHKTGTLPVPLHLRNAPTKLMKDIGYSKNYKYAHDFENNFAEQEFLPDMISGTAFYKPQNNHREEEHRKFLRDRWKAKYGY